MINGGIYCTGNIVVDTLVRPVDGMPPWSTTTYVESISTHLGGNGAVTAYAAAMMGVPVKLAGAVGRDHAGDYAVERLASAGVDVSTVRRLEGAATAETVGLVNREGNRLFFHELGASAVFSAADLSLDAEAVNGLGIFHYGSVFCLPALRPDARRVLERAKAAGMTVSVDSDWDTEGRWIEEFGPLCPLMDYLFVYLEEGAKLTGRTASGEIGGFFRDRGVPTVVVKTGARGCSVFSAAGSFESPAFEVEVLDSTGAGDCFCGAFLAGLCRGFDPQEAARLANAVAAHCIQRVGCSEGVADFKSTRDWMAQRQSGASG
jgi:sugar/nucleoside kinase (ribokinase family)